MFLNNVETYNQVGCPRSRICRHGDYDRGEIKPRTQWTLWLCLSLSVSLSLFISFSLFSPWLVTATKLHCSVHIREVSGRALKLFRNNSLGTLWLANIASLVSTTCTSALRIVYDVYFWHDIALRLLKRLCLCLQRRISTPRRHLNLDALKTC